MQRVEFAVTYPEDRAHPIHGAVQTTAGVSRAELLIWGPTGRVTSLLWFDCPVDTARRLLGAVEARTTELIGEDGGTYAFLEQETYELDAAVLGVVADAHVVFLPPVVFEESGNATVEAVGSREALGACYEALRERVPTTIKRVRPFRRGGESGALTDRQRAAVEAASAVGYYDVPRTGSVADVAAELDCAHSTAGELLRKAEAALVDAAVDAG
ncbi:helix-turn-helix domain-containing protein [Halomicroarcula sp. GCM10025709]|uniref:helix-turn-helix domain-containing protein n=1 Tax=Haloarcula TaxID=2237 RepID=UPI0024C2602C|nr:helix-turn-helix domain-containing protein [Halomicroarcula sp. YJ-61-S]